MLTIVRLDDLFADGGDVRTVPRRDGALLSDYGLRPGDVAAINGRLVQDPETVVPADGVTIVYTPRPAGSKEDWRPVAQFAVLAATAVVPGGPIIAAATYIGGNLLVNHFLPPAPPSADEREYVWDQLRNRQAVYGLPIPVVYGTIRVAPALKDRYFASDATLQYLYALYSCAGHKLDSIADIEINGNPASNYREVETNTTGALGTLAQNALPGFNETYTDHAVSTELVYATGGEGDFVTVDLTDISTAHAFRVDIAWPDGLYGYEVDGSGVIKNIKVQTARFIIEYTNDNGAHWWQAVPINIGHYRDYWYPIFGLLVNYKATNRAMYRSWRFEPTYTGSLKVRIRKASDTLPNAVDTAILVNVSAITNANGVGFRYPGEALFSIRALATDQLSSAFGITAKVTRSTVKVWTGSAWVDKPATNPAWACYDMLANGSPGHPALAIDGSRYGAGIDTAKLPYAVWNAFAAQCTDIGAAVNACFDRETTVWDAALTIAALGRGTLRIVGTQIVPAWDAAATAAQLFSVGNITAGSFREEWVGSQKRADSVEITFLDAARNWERTTITVRADTRDEEDIRRVERIELAGCTSYDQAYRHGRYLLRASEVATRICSFEADIDALAAEYGDVVKVQHHVPAWGAGGRIVSSRREDVDIVTLDRKVDLVAMETYELIVRHDTDVLESHAFVAPSTITTDTFEFTVDTWTTLPETYAPYAFALQGLTTKEVRIVGITRTDDEHVRIDAIEYNASVYDLDGEFIPVRNPSALILFATAFGLAAEEKRTFRNDGTYEPTIDLVWSAPAEAVWREWRVWMRDITTEDAKWIGEWSSAVTYTDGEAVIWGEFGDGNAYISLANGNLNHDPFTGGSGWWARIFPTVNWRGDWEGEVSYDAGDGVCSGFHGYVSSIDGNAAIEPPQYPEWENAPEVGWRAVGLVRQPSFIAADEDFVVGHTYEFAVTARSATGGEEPVTTAPRVQVTITGKLIPPDPPDDLTATADKIRIKLAWTPSPSRDVAYYEVWRSNTASHAAGISLAKVNATTHLDYVASYGVTRYYWVRAIDRDGNASAWEPSSGGAGASAATAKYTASDVENLNAGAITSGTLLATPVRTASSGARVEILWPETEPGVYDVGLGVIDGSGNYVLKAMVGGDAVGDVQIGRYDIGKGILWDQSASSLIMLGTLKTATSGKRIEIRQADNTLRFFDDTDEVIIIDDNIDTSGYPGMMIAAAGRLRMFWTDDSNSLLNARTLRFYLGPGMTNEQLSLSYSGDASGVGLLDFAEFSVPFAAPSETINSRMYYNPTTNRLYVYNGGWKSILFS
jgi:hypothetical protein